MKFLCELPEDLSDIAPDITTSLIRLLDIKFQHDASGFAGAPNEFANLTLIDLPGYF
jgi:hypothetical protein